MLDSWTVIVLTCVNESSLNVIEGEVKELKAKGRISQNTEILGVQDPSENIGSGAATLNALYTVTEYLSALNNYATFNTDVLQKSKILILHCGRHYVFESGNLKAMISLKNVKNPDGQCKVEPIKNVEHLINIVTDLNFNKETNSLHYGVWVCSTDMSLQLEGSIAKENFNPCHPTIFCIEALTDYATKHGTVCVNSDGFVENIIYCGKKEVIEKYENANGVVNVICGIVFLPVEIADNMLVFNSLAPLNRCTYMGLDCGSEPLQISLFFDILVAMGLDVTKDDFVAGNCGKLYEVKLNQSQRNAITRARNIVWSYLSKYKLRSITIQNCQYIYWDDRLNCKNHLANLLKYPSIKPTWSYSEPNIANKNIFTLNSIIKSEKDILIGNNTAVCHSLLIAKEINIGSNCLLNGVDFTTKDNISIPDGTVLIGFHTMEKDKIYIVLGIDDLPQNSMHELTKESPINMLIKYLNVNIDKNQPLEECRLYKHSMKIQEILDLVLSKHIMKSTLTTNDKNLSINNIMEMVQLEKENQWRLYLRKKIYISSIQDIIKTNTNASLIPYFKIANQEGWANELLDTLEDLAPIFKEDYFKLCRILSSTADLLGTMAGNLGKIRSGPGNNKSWEASFHYLKIKQIEEGLLALKTERKNWMKSDNLIVRAARHYERALQILIQNAVLSAKDFIILKPADIPFGHWVIVECPARADLQGGWTDTPPICYEQGGSVVNVALLVDGKKPIGAKAKLIKEYKISCLTTSNQSNIPEVLEISKVEDLLDYNEPSSPGALIKAAIIATKLISITSGSPFVNQLANINGGVEIHIWSNLPKGSGLGTSSILASAVIAAFWTVTGKKFTKATLLHAVLYLEQLMTTGGGWQDQVGGVMGGVNRGFSKPHLPLQIQVETIPISQEQIAILNDHLLLIYTGKVRLAKNLLQNVIRNWYAREEEIVKCFQKLQDHSFRMANAIKNVNLPEIGQEMNIYWNMKKILAPGCDPSIIRQLMGILEPRVWGQILVGAGGGGFMCVLTKTPRDKRGIEELIKKSKLPQTITVHSTEIDLVGITIYIGDQRVNIS